jgi:hypothetical protein
VVAKAACHGLALFLSVFLAVSGSSTLPT